MSGKTTHEFDVLISDKGTAAKTNKEVKKLHDTIEQTKSAAARPAKETAAYNKAKSATDTPGMERGATGVGGGSGAKDFSRQAQGLGGLVHVYATFAANIFAVSAAFTALSKAADYTNMVSGLDQLGAASGRNLGYLAKDLVKATDGAVSLKEAMASVAQASSAGMDSTQIARLGELSKKASQALGRDMGDSLNRLTRGITKIEPELLDELGIFVRVDKAAADYARTIGKTASGLTEYERRQAFANAALDQAQKKFGAIELAANPYSKLQASFVDLLYKGGELVNKVLGPIVGLLAQSPLALGTVIAGFTGMLLSKAIPALGQWRKGLVDSAETAAKKAAQMRESLQEYKIGKENAQIAIHEDNASKYNTQAYNFANDNKLFGKRSKSLYNLAAGDSSTAEAQSRIKLVGIETQIRNVKASQGALNQQDKLIAQQRLALLEVEKKKHLDLLAIIKMETFEKEQANLIERQGAVGGLDEKIRDIEAKRSARKAFSSRSLASFSENIEGRGFGGAWEQLNSDIKQNRGGTEDDKLSKLGAGALRAKAGIVTLTSAISTAISFLGPYIMLIGLAVAAFQLLDGWLTTNSKQQEKFKESTEKADSAVDSLNNTLKLLETRDPFEKMSVDILLARANALKEIGSSMKELLRDFNEVQSSQSIWSGTVDWVSDFWGGSNSDKLRSQMAASISAAAKGLPDTEAGKSTKEALENLLGTKDLSKKGISGVLDEEKIKSATDLLNKYGEKSSRSLNNLKGAFEGLNEASKDYDNVVNSLTSSDPFTRMALSSAKAFGQIITQLDTAENKFAAFQEITKDFNKLRLLPEGVGIELIKTSSELSRIKGEIEATQNALDNSREQAKKANDLYAMNSTSDAEIGGVSDRSSELGSALLEENANVEKLESRLNRLKNDQIKMTGDIVEAFQKGAVDAVTKLQQGITIAFEKAKIDTTRALISKSTPTFSGIQLEANLKKQEIDIGLRQLKASVNMLFSQERLRLAIEENTLKDKNPNSPLLTGIKKAQEALTGKNSDEIIGNLDKLMKSDAKSEAEKNAKAFATTAFGAVIGLREKQIVAKGQKGVIDINEKQDKTDLAGKRRQEELDHEAKLLDAKLKDLDISNKATGVYDKQLTLRKHALEISQESNTANKLDEEYQNTIKGILEKRKAGADRTVNDEEIRTAASEYARKLEEQKENNRLNAKNRGIELVEGEISINKAKREEAEKYLDLQLRTNSILEESGAITKSESEAFKFKIDQTKHLAQYQEDIAASELKRNTTNAAVIDAEVAKKEQLYKATERVAQAEFNYQQALQKNIDLLKSLETSGSYGTKYFGAVADDFSNKLTQLIKASKSAADVFNEGLINMIDKTIDKFYELMQRSELTLKDMVFFARNALSDVFRDAAAQTMKNAWKQAVKGTMLETEADKAAREAVEAQKALALKTEAMNTNISKIAIDNHAASIGKLDEIKQAILDKKGGVSTKSAAEESTPVSVEPGDGMLAPYDNGYSQSTNEGDAMSALWDYSAPEKMEESADYFKDSSYTLSTVAIKDQITADKNKKTTDTMGTIVGTTFSDIANRFLDSTGIFGQFVKSLLFSNMFSGGGSGGSDPLGGIFGTLAKAAIGSMTGGVGFGDLAASADTYGISMFGQQNQMLAAQDAWFKSAKGNVFSGYHGLSAYSNSIVSSPTYFAKGGVPGMNVMGEAGPEAIIPLKRDSQGNLGVSGGGSGGNNIEINITISDGAASNTSSKGDASSTAGQLGNIIKQVVGQELIKQTRPGGLLAR